MLCHFFLIILIPTQYTLFPYTTLFRSSSSWKRFCLFVCRALSSIMVICMLTAIRLLLTFVMSLYHERQKQRSEERFSRNADTDLVCRLLLEKKKQQEQLRMSVIKAREE